MDSSLPTFPLTLSQMLIWGAEMNLTSLNNILCGMVRWKGAWAPEQCNRAIQQILKDNEGLRLRMKIQSAVEVRQYVAPYQETPVSFIDFSYPGGAADFQKWATQEAIKHFKIFDSNLVNFTVIRLGLEENGLLIRIHHIITDAWSLTLIYNQFFRHLKALENGKTLNDLEPAPVSFVEYLTRQTAPPMSSEKVESFMQYIEKFAATPAAIWIEPNPPIYTNRDARRITFSLPETLRAGIAEFSQRNRNSVYLFFLTGTLLYLSLVNRQEDAALGTLFHNRINPKYQKTIGMFSTILPFRVKVERSLTFHELLNRVLTAWKQAIMRHPTILSMKELVRVFEKTGSLYNVLLDYENYLPDQPLEWFNQARELDPPLSLDINFFDHPSVGIQVEFLYRTEIFSESSIEGLYGRMMDLWAYLIKNPEERIEKFKV